MDLYDSGVSFEKYESTDVANRCESGDSSVLVLTHLSLIFKVRVLRNI